MQRSVSLNADIDWSCVLWQSSLENELMLTNLYIYFFLQRKTEQADTITAATMVDVNDEGAAWYSVFHAIVELSGRVRSHISWSRFNCRTVEAGQALRVYLKHFDCFVSILDSMSYISSTKVKHMSPDANITLVGRRISSVIRRLNHVNLHRFWARWSGKGDNRRLGVGLGNSEVLTEGNRKCLLQCGRIHTLTR